MTIVSCKLPGFTLISASRRTLGMARSPASMQEVNRLRRELEETRKKHVKLQEDREQLKERLSATEQESKDCKDLVQMIIGRMNRQDVSGATTAVSEEKAVSIKARRVMLHPL